MGSPVITVNEIMYEYYRRQRRELQKYHRIAFLFSFFSIYINDQESNKSFIAFSFSVFWGSMSLRIWVDLWKAKGKGGCGQRMDR